MRLFIAIRFSREVEAALGRAIASLRAVSAGGNFTRAENLHLTLAFIGESRETKTLCRVIDKCAGAAFPLAVGGAGRFGDLYWVGVAPNPALEALAGRLQEELRRTGFPVEARPFRPHITIARRVQGAHPLAFEAPRAEMTVTRISLMESLRQGGKLVYRELYARTLTPPPERAPAAGDGLRSGTKYDIV